MNTHPHLQPLELGIMWYFSGHFIASVAQAKTEVLDFQ